MEIATKKSESGFQEELCESCKCKDCDFDFGMSINCGSCLCNCRADRGCFVCKDEDENRIVTDENGDCILCGMH